MSEQLPIDIDPAKPSVPIAGAAPKTSLMPMGDRGVVLSSYEDAYRFARSVVQSGLAPKSFQTAEAVLIAVQMGSEIGLAPMQSLQNIAVINGRPSVYGTAGKALLRSKGFDIQEMDTVEIQEKGFARCIITHPRQKPVIRTFSVEDAKAAGLWNKSGPWTQYPARQLSWRAFWFAARDAAADVLAGISGAEEVSDIPPEPKNVTPSDLDSIDK